MSTPTSVAHDAVAVKQRADLTFKHNMSNGRHGWLRLTPAYSVKVVDDILCDSEGRANVFDPFSGTATTPLCAGMRGHAAVALDINPFLVWFGQAKVRAYSDDDLAHVEQCTREVLSSLRRGAGQAVAPPPISNMDRWWGKMELGFLCAAKGGIEAVCPDPGPVRDLLLIAFCRTMMALSNVAFNHQSMSFKPRGAVSGQMALFREDEPKALRARFHEDVRFVLAGASLNPSRVPHVLQGDSRHIPRVFDDGADLLITSPPYPNRMSYIRELRPYMFWLGFLKEAREAGEMDWEAIGGTWGIATSRVASWERTANTFTPPYLAGLLDRIRRSDAKSGDILARYVGKYFEDIWLHLQSAVQAMKPGGEMHYIVGNSKFYDVLVPVERVYEDMLKQLGVAHTEIRALRKRSSKKELVEYDVIATV